MLKHPNTGEVMLLIMGKDQPNSYILNEPECVEAKNIYTSTSKRIWSDNILLFDYDEYELSQSWVSRKTSWTTPYYAYTS